jgi:hypothetical protein
MCLEPAVAQQKSEEKINKKTGACHITVEIFVLQKFKTSRVA